MNSNINQTEKVSSTQLNELIVDCIQDIKGKNIVQLDLRELDDSPTDFFVICEGDSTTQVKAIADNISFRIKNEGNTLPSNVAGMRESTWVCLDYFNTVVHVFNKEKREFYELEDLWSDAKFTEYQD